MKRINVQMLNLMKRNLSRTPEWCKSGAKTALSPLSITLAHDNHRHL